MSVHRKLTGAVVIATHNPGKLAELRELLAPFGIAAQSAGELGLAEPEETGKTFAGQCAHQSHGRRHALRQPAFADDAAWWSTRSAAIPAFSPRAGPDPTRISAPP